MRRTTGIDIEGNAFAIEDDWTNAQDAHRVLEIPWIGATTFTTKEEAVARSTALRRKSASKVRWGDEVDPIKY